MTRGISEDQLENLLKAYISNPETSWHIKWLLDNECKELNPWLPIDENAPKDREIILFNTDGTKEIDYYNESYYYNMPKPTHWQELPEDPK